MPKLIDVDEVFHAAVRVFAECGYDAATMQEIASRAGINEVTLYRRFGGKAALIEAALTGALEAAPLGQVEASEDVRTDLAAIAQAYAQTNRKYGDAVVTLLAESPRHPELRGAISALMPNLQRAARIIAVHQERGVIAPGDPLQKVVFLISPMLAEGLWRRGGAAAAVAALEPAVVAEAFLEGHGSALRGDGEPAGDVPR